MSKALILVGMSGSGKTYWGRKIAAQFHLPFVDLDAFIEEQEQKTISELFAQHGESGFREKEHKALKIVLEQQEKPFVLSSGGGTIAFHQNLELMKQHGYILYLKASIPFLLQHLQKENKPRPLLMTEDIPTQLNLLLKKRSFFYEQADYIFDAENLSIENLEPIISSCTN